MSSAVDERGLAEGEPFAARSRTGSAVSRMRPTSHDCSWRSRADAAMARYACGEDAAFESLYDALSSHLYAFLLRRVRAPDKAKDLFQQTFLRIHEARGRYDAAKSVVAWSFAIGHRFCIDVARRTRPEVSSVEDDAGSAAQAWLEERDWDALIDAKVALGLVQRELERWSEEQRHLFSFAYVEGLSNGEIAAILGTTENAVKQRMKRLRAALEVALKGCGGRPK